MFMKPVPHLTGSDYMKKFDIRGGFPYSPRIRRLFFIIKLTGSKNTKIHPLGRMLLHTKHYGKCGEEKFAGYAGRRQLY
jgi:hypothetical protein